ncbi:protoporphyrinogen oxidase, partial [Francisella tularensis subsp. holarctica]|nr:protoporphyrinogen oxidase [Francisella tularensis subsp. holarctica]
TTPAPIIHTYTKPNTLPCYHRKHSAFIASLEKVLQNQPNLYISGNFFDGLAIENWISRSIEQAG